MEINPANGFLGLNEWISLPDLGMIGLRAKIDTGASISTLHATDIQPFQRQGVTWVRFRAHFGTLVQRGHRCEARVLSTRTIRSSNGQVQERYVIATHVALGAQMWLVEFSLTCRQTMRYRVLLGAKALIEGGWMVNPALSYIQPKPFLQ